MALKFQMAGVPVGAIEPGWSGVAAEAPNATVKIPPVRNGLKSRPVIDVGEEIKSTKAWSVAVCVRAENENVGGSMIANETDWPPLVMVKVLGTTSTGPGLVAHGPREIMRLFTVAGRQSWIRKGVDDRAAG